MPRFLLTFTLMLLAAMPVFAGDDAPYTTIDAQALKAMMDEGNVVVVDSRGGKYFDGTIIAGAVNLSAKETNEESLLAIAPNKDGKIVFYCTNLQCPASEVAAYKADKAGYTNIYKYPGGIEDWIGHSLPTSTL